MAAGGVLRVVRSLVEPTRQPMAMSAERFDELVERLSPELFGLAYRVLGERMACEDVLQEAFLQLSWAPALLQRPDPEIAAWLRRVVLHRAFNTVRGERRAQARLERAAQLDRVGPSGGSEISGADAAAVRQEDQTEVRRALAELPERQRACLLLRHSGYSYAEIAHTLGIAVGSVGVLLARAEAAFRQTYRRHTP